MTVKDHIQGHCTFLYYKDSQLWYQTENTNLIFPVPVEDIGTATFDASIKGLLLMRYIRKWLDVISDKNATIV